MPDFNIKSMSKVINNDISRNYRKLNKNNEI